jgi:glycosyltransferase involved in cell wall biosynthesis
MSLKPSLTICVQNKIGGVQFYYTNLVRTGVFKEFDIHYLVIDECEDLDTKLLASLEGANSKFFYYGDSENIYHSCRRFARNFPKQPGLILTNWDFELRCLDVRRSSGLTVVHTCHDEIYVPTALRYSHIIDVFVAHNPYFAERLRNQLPTTRQKDVYFLPFGIYQDPKVQRIPNPNRSLRIVFIGRFHRTKGVLELPLVDDQLSEMGVEVEWIILGNGPERDNLKSAVANRTNFKILSPPDNASMLREAAKGDIFVLPSRLDGTPLAVMEAMSVGLVPIVAEFNPGVHWMVPPHTGFICPIEPMQIAKVIARLHAERAELEIRSQAAIRHARDEFAAGKRASAYAELFSNWKTLKRPVNGSAKHYGSRLDQPWLPNSFVVGVRRLLRWLRSSRLH